ncbi:ribonuclease H-like domain-containing protein, partial [Chloroflexota bacterium]
VVGIYLVNGGESRMAQLVGQDISKDNLIEILNGVQNIFTYNGGRFDLPFIQWSLGINLETLAYHHDLMYDCWRCNLYGGLKVVERQLNIPRKLQGISGLDAVMLWSKYLEQGDQNALTTLLKYNEEDVMNLKELREKLSRNKTRRDV